MQRSDSPALIPLPFANTGSKRAVPTLAASTVAANQPSLELGFPAVTMIPKTAGGIPPAGPDFNGIFNLLSGANRYAQAGGLYPYNSAFATSIGGYPKGAMLLSADGVKIWQSSIENNTADPDGSGAVGWSHLLDAVSVKRFGAKGDGVYDYVTQTLTSGTDDTAAIQAAIDYCVQSNIIANGRPCAVFFPHGIYKITDDLLIRGAVALVGDGAPMSISGARIMQVTAHKSVFNSTSATNSAIHVQGLLLRDMSGVADSTVGLFKHSPGVTSGNSFYFRWNWFSTPSVYAINIDEHTDDLQIVDNTFDVTAQRWIKLGSASGQATNTVISGNTFYQGTNSVGCIDVVNVRGLQITNNRVYGGGFRIPYFVNCNTPYTADLVQVSGNVIDEVNLVCYTTKNGLQMVGNTVGRGSILVQFQGGLPIYDALIKSNRFEGATSIIGAGGIIDATGTPLLNCDLSGNVLRGDVGGTTAIGVNIPHSGSAGNEAKNRMRGVTAKYTVASAINNGLSGYLQTSWGAWNPVIAAGAYVENSISVPGLSASDVVMVSPVLPINLQAGLIVSCYATVDNIVVRYSNITGASITAATQAFKGRAFRADDF
jgi:Pectate lyase superfamily protein